jgi:hypothetical protein
MPFDSITSHDPVRWTLVARPFSTDRQEKITPSGLTLAQMLELSDLPQRYWPYIQVFVDDEEVPRRWWRQVRPKPKARLFVRVCRQRLHRKSMQSGRPPKIMKEPTVILPPWPRKWSGVSGSACGPNLEIFFLSPSPLLPW